MAPNLEEEEDVEKNEEEELDSIVWTNVNPPHISIPEDFKDDHEDSDFGIIKKKTSSSKVEFSKGTIPAKTYAYRKLMGPESNGRIRGVRNEMAPSEFHSKSSFQSGIRTLGSSMISVLLKEVKSFCQKKTTHLIHPCIVEQRGVDDIMNDTGSSKDTNNNTSTSHNQIKHS
ncbi:hypothetical protein Cgig2_032874 [Carnegiea gigantea]|uniref:Uncharacterized protein n=1 Tax=Carnegiea gigantea TaxID=171969 RepID=A0A9Q1Q6A6_9CARY|nr:hypothetical protein Cgig2_032874 [Carnegiea gigantea]